jgi:hypothetical protein
MAMTKKLKIIQIQRKIKNGKENVFLKANKKVRRQFSKKNFGVIIIQTRHLRDKKLITDAIVKLRGNQCDAGLYLFHDATLFCSDATQNIHTTLWIHLVQKCQLNWNKRLKILMSLN